MREFMIHDFKVEGDSDELTLRMTVEDALHLMSRLAEDIKHACPDGEVQIYLKVKKMGEYFAKS